MPFIKHKRYLLPYVPSPIPTQAASQAVVGEFVVCTNTGRAWIIGATNTNPWIPFPVAPTAVGVLNPGAIAQRVFFDQGPGPEAKLVLKNDATGGTFSCEVGSFFTNPVRIESPSGTLVNEGATTLESDVTVTPLPSTMISTDATGKLTATTLGTSTLLGRNSATTGSPEAVTVGTGLTMSAGADLSLDIGTVQDEIRQAILLPSEPSLFRDEFVSLSLTTGLIGELGWRTSNGTVSNLAPEVDHPGILRRDSSATSGQVSSLFLAATATNTLFRWDQFGEMTVCVRLFQITNVTFRFGVATSADGNAPGSGAYFEATSAANNIIPVLKSGVNTNLPGNSWTLDTNWHTFHIHRISQNSVKFQIDNGPQYTETIGTGGGITDTTAMQWFFQIIPTSASARSMDIDFFSSRLSAQSR